MKSKFKTRIKDFLEKLGQTFEYVATGILWFLLGISIVIVLGVAGYLTFNQPWVVVIFIAAYLVGKKYPIL